MGLSSNHHAIKEEYLRASKIFGKFTSAHEGIAVIREEYLELEREVFKKNPNKNKLRDEAIQLGAMALRFLQDINLEDK